MRQRREDWIATQPNLDAKRLLFIDETCLNTKMTRLYGWGERSKRLLCSAPYGHWNTTTFIAALRHDKLTAPFMINGSMTGEAFYTYVEKILCPELNVGDIVICDNLASHKMAGIKELIESVGAEIRYLPPYSPDLNPIEMAFSKLKSFMKKKAARTFEALQDATAEALETFTPTICSKLLHHANYRAT